MKPFLVLAKTQTTPFIKRLIEEVGDSKIQFLDPWSSMTGSISYDRCLVRTSGVYGDDQDLNFLKKFTGEVVNPLESLEQFRRKSTQYEFFIKNNLPIIPWLSLADNSVVKIEDWIRQQAGTRFLVKPDRGQGGWGISIFNSSALIDWYQNQKAKGDLDFILQPYLSDAEEFRTFFILDESWTLRRSPADDAVAANFRQTGSAVKARAPEPITRQIEQLISLSGASYGAIDYFVINGELFILELNVVPGLEQLEQVTGENIMAKLVRKLLSFG